MSNELTPQAVEDLGGDVSGDREGTRYYHLDKKNQIVTGSCDHYFYVDEILGDIRHVACEKCGYGKYINRNVLNGKILDANE